MLHRGAAAIGGLTPPPALCYNPRMMTDPIHILQQAVDVDYVALLVAQNRCAANDPIEDFLLRFGVPLSTLTSCMAHPEFETKLQQHMRELKANGFSVEAKAAMLHEAGLPTVFQILQDPDAPASARLKAHEQLGDIAQKGKLAAKQVQVSAGNGYQLIINLGAAVPSESFKGVTVTQEQAATPLPTTLTDSDSLFPATRLALHGLATPADTSDDYYDAEAA